MALEVATTVLLAPPPGSTVGVPGLVITMVVSGAFPRLVTLTYKTNTIEQLHVDLKCGICCNNTVGPQNSALDNWASHLIRPYSSACFM